MVDRPRGKTNDLLMCLLEVGRFRLDLKVGSIAEALPFYN